MAFEGYEVAAEMVQKAAALLEAAGFTSDQSSLGDARYFTKPGSVAKIRLATYSHAHPDQVAVTFDHALVQRCGLLSDAEIAKAVADALAEYEALAADLAEEDEE